MGASNNKKVYKIKIMEPLDRSSARTSRTPLLEQEQLLVKCSRAQDKELQPQQNHT
jgi:hypothetical protein